MEKQFIVAIGREYGSGGREIAKTIAERLNVSFYDREMLNDLAKEHDMPVDDLKKYDEKPRNLLFSRRVGNYSNSPEDIVAEFQFNFLKEKAASGESFVIVGRCADAVLEGNEGLITIFVNGDEANKVARLEAMYQLSEHDAKETMHHKDATRKKYHNHYTDHEWGVAKYYDLCINSKMGVEKTVDTLMHYIELRIA